MRGVTPARACALAVVRRVFEDGAWADRALHGEARRLSSGPATAPSPCGSPTAPSSAGRRSTTSPRRSPSRPLARLEPLVLAALRLGLYQVAFLDRIPAHAAVGETVALVKADAPRGGGPRQRGPAPRGPRGAARSRALPERHAGRGGAAPLPPRVDRRAVVGGARRGGGAGAAWRPTTSPRRPPCAPTPSASRREALAARLPVPARPADGPAPEGLVLDGAFDAFASPAVGGRAVHAAVARGDGGGPAARPPAGGAGARPVRGARRQDDPPRGADGGPRRDRGGGAARRPRRALGRTVARMGADRLSASAPRTPPPSTSPTPTTGCSSTRPAPISARSPPARTRAGARRPTRRPARACAGRHPPRGRRGRAAGRDARLLDLHDLPGGERGSGAGVPRRAPGLRGRRPAWRRAAVGASRHARRAPHPAAPRPYGGLLHGPAPPGERP